MLVVFNEKAIQCRTMCVSVYLWSGCHTDRTWSILKWMLEQRYAIYMMGLWKMGYPGLGPFGCIGIQFCFLPDSSPEGLCLVVVAGSCWKAEIGMNWSTL